jgi:hypothetical protein
MKSPEEMAEEYVHAWWGPREDNMTLATRQSFLAGYQAAKDHLPRFHAGADVYIIDANNPLPKPMPLTMTEQVQFADTRKVMDSSNNSNGWISVKDRLPEVGERGYSDDVLMLSEHGMEVTHIEKVKRIVKWRGLEEVIETNNGTPIEDFTHWMPLPQPPKEEA